ncbi:bifunctional riboflavin kinase/FAD synthetase [Butyricimonas paravirosa]|uniref:bifunctional riboflavin kinase/FAD synthetase n=1 Tax=Butyricimonas paravirosa TaxID=1472417 RepID=UPI00210BD03E|nr:bifunctional riboflavin kinase/FAD synthetase [Butyricimonas paravirosa]MCQ4875813.1 bifunctional riboflavin kinase/FAD synthetase [Butyricimonas paravirosa]
MKVHYEVENIDIKYPVVTIGSFDGVHLGHACVIQHLKEKAASIGGESVIISFEPHPREVLYPREKKIGILTTLEEKIAILEKYGVDHLIILKFTLEFAQQSYFDFVEKILVDKIKIKGLVVGYDHRFGKDRAGNFENLQELSRKYGFFLEKEVVFEEDDVNVSSTKIRNALAVGDITTVNRFLGYPYSITGKVVNGHRLGHTIGFPTANIQIFDDRKLLPAIGVYAVKVLIGPQIFNGMLNIGIRPTVSDDGRVSCEVYIFDFNRNIYGETISIHFITRIRGERKFNDIEELRTQLQKDQEKIFKILE